VKLSTISLSFVVAAVACGGTASSSTPPPPDTDAGSTDAGNQDAGGPDAGSPDAGNPDGGGPLASFTAAAAAVALSEVVFDGSASAGAASFSWDFGDGEHGGMGKISHAFAQAGSFTVKLTVADSSGKTNSARHAITVSAAAHAAEVAVSGLVHDVNGPLAGVTVQDVNGSSASTATDGKVVISLTAGVAHTLKLSKAGYSDQYQPINLDAAAASGYFQTVLTAQEAPQNLNATTGGSLAGKDGAKITLPAGAVQGATGTIQISMTPVDISGPMLATFPGKFSGTDANGLQGPIATYGTTEFTLTQGGQRLQLAPGKTATIELPLYATKNLDGTNVSAGETIPLWSLSEKTGQWVQEGAGTVVVSSSSPSGFALQAQVSHFSWWNCDHFFDPPPYKPKPKCFKNAPAGQPPIPVPCSIGKGLPGQPGQPSSPIRRTAIRPAAAFAFPPAYLLRADIPLGGGLALPVPANADFPLDACTVSDGSLYCGQLTVHGASDVSEDVTILLDPVAAGGSCGAPTAIVPPFDQAFSVSSAAQPSCFQLTAATGQFLTVQAGQTLGTDLAGTLQITNSGGQVLDTATFGGNGPGTVGVIIQSTGTYGVKVSPTAATAPGGFTLTAVLDSGQALAIPSSATFATDAATGTRVFNYNAAAGDVIAVTVTGPQTTVRSLPGGAIVSNGKLTVPIAAAGTFFFEVHTAQLGANVVVSISKAQAITLGQTVPNVPFPLNVIKSYVFTASAGQVISALTRSDTNGLPTLQLFDPSGQQVFGLVNSSFFVTGPIPVAITGLYRLDAVQTNQFAGPAANLRVALISPPTAVTETAPITTISSSVDAIGDEPFYTVHLTAGDVVRFALHTSSTFAAHLMVSVPSSFSFFTNVQSIFTSTEPPSTAFTLSTLDTATDLFLVPATGDYIVHLEHDTQFLANATGAFSWTLLHPAAVPLTQDVLHHGSLNGVPYQFDRYVITLPNAGAAGFFTTPIAGGGLNPTARVRDSAGQFVPSQASSQGSVDNEIVGLFPAGTYTYEIYQSISSTNSCTFGSNACLIPPVAYDVILPSIEAPAAIAPGDTLNATLDLAERDYYQFTANAGQTYTITTTSASVAGTIVVYPLVSGDFTRDFGAVKFASVGTSFTVTPTASDTFIIELDGIANLGSFTPTTGGYTISLQ
jgi:hypothetical protein